MEHEEMQAAERARAYWRANPQQQPRLLMEATGIDENSSGAIVWAALTLATAAGVKQPDMVGQLCKAGRLPRPALYRMMNRAMSPALDAEPELLEFLGLHRCENAAELARAVARSMRECGFRGKEEGGTREWQQALKFG